MSAPGISSPWNPHQCRSHAWRRGFAAPRSRAQCIFQYYHNYKSQFGSIVLFASYDNRGKSSRLYAGFQCPRDMIKSLWVLNETKHLKNVITYDKKYVSHPSSSFHILYVRYCVSVATRTITLCLGESDGLRSPPLYLCGIGLRKIANSYLSNSCKLHFIPNSRYQGV